MTHATAQALLAYLAVRPGRRHPRDKLAMLLWPGTADEHARQNLRQTLVRLRRALGTAATLATDGREVAIEAPGLVQSSHAVYWDTLVPAILTTLTST